MFVWMAMTMAVQAAPKGAPVDACLSHGAVRPCRGLQLAVHTDAGSFDSFVFAMHHPQADVFWFQDRETGAFLRVAASSGESPSPFLGEGWTATTADGVAYRVERVLRETYVMRRDHGPVAARVTARLDR